MTPRLDNKLHRARVVVRLIVASVAGVIAAVAFVMASGGIGGSSGSMTPAAALRATGPLSIVNSKGSSAVLTASGMAPGQFQTGDVDIQNASSIDATFALAQSNVTGATLAGNLSLSVVDCGTFAGATAPTCDVGDPQVYSGALNGVPTTPLGAFAAGVTHRYRFRVAFPNGTPAHDNLLQGLSTSVQFDWTADAPEPTTTTEPPTTTTQPPVTTTAPLTTTPPTTTTAPLNPSGTPTGAPKLSLVLPRSSSNTSQVSFVAVCDRACALTVGGTLTVPGAAKTYKLTTVKKTLKAGVRVTVRVPFSKAARTALAKAVKRGKRASVRLTMTTRSGTASSTTRRTIVIKKKR
jgi:hypothetical protein